jgi:hypothetical protein
MTPETEGRQRAIELLRQAATPHGFVASLERTANYHRVWCRDGVICGLAGLVAGEEELTEALRATLETLAAHQGPEGQIPSNVRIGADGEVLEVSLGGTAGRVDTIPWFVIGVGQLAEHAGGAELAAAMEPAVRRGLRLLTAWEFNRRGLIYVPQSGSWADEYHHHGYLLHVQLLRLWALRCAARLYGRRELAETADRLARLVWVNFWPRGEDEGSDLVYHRYLWARRVETLGEPHYGLCGLLPSGYIDQFDALGNALAVLLDVPSAAATRRLLDHGRILCDVGPTDLVPCHWPPVTRDDPQWKALAANAAFGFKNEPGCYHNGGIWPMVNGWWGLALCRAGRLDEAQRLLARIDALNRRDAEPGGGWGFHEFADARSGEPGGTRHLAWSAAGGLLLHEALAGRTPRYGLDPER